MKVCTLFDWIRLCCFGCHSHIRIMMMRVAFSFLSCSFTHTTLWTHLLLLHSLLPRGFWRPTHNLTLTPARPLHHHMNHLRSLCVLLPALTLTQPLLHLSILRDGDAIRNLLLSHSARLPQRIRRVVHARAFRLLGVAALRRVVGGFRRVVRRHRVVGGFRGVVRRHRVVGGFRGVVRGNRVVGGFRGVV